MKLKSSVVGIDPENSEQMFKTISTSRFWFMTLGREKPARHFIKGQFPPNGCSASRGRYRGRICNPPVDIIQFCRSKPTPPGRQVSSLTPGSKPIIPRYILPVCFWRLDDLYLAGGRGPGHPRRGYSIQPVVSTTGNGEMIDFA